MKFTLNKFAKMDNIEDYYYYTVKEFYQDYIKYVKDMDGHDPDFPKSELKFETD